MRSHAAWWGALGVGLLCQSALFPLFFSPPWSPDFTRILVLWAALTGLPRGGSSLAFAAGLLLDLASGAPLGFGAVQRLVLYGLARPLRGVFFDDRPLLLLPVAALAAALDAVVAGSLSGMGLVGSIPASMLAATAGRQALVDALWVPLTFVVLELATGRRPAREVVV